MNKLLKRQLKRNTDGDDLDLDALLENVSSTYDEQEQLRRLAERTHKTLEDEVMSLNAMARENMQQVKDILDAIDEGIVTLDGQMRLGKQSSDFVFRFFKARPEALAGGRLFEVLLVDHSLTPDEVARLESTIDASVGQPILTWELNESHLPDKCTVTVEGEIKYLNLSWTALTGESDMIVKQVMLTISDETAQAELEKQVEGAKRQQERFMRIVGQLLSSNRERVASALLSMRNQLTEIEGQLVAKEPDKDKVKMETHTLKGDARALKFDQVVGKAHEFEAVLAIQDWDCSTVRGSFQALMIEVEALASIAENQLGMDVSDASVNDFCLVNVVTDIVNSAQPRISQGSCRLAELICENELGDQSVANARALRTILVHAINNSIDHGYLLALGAKPEIRLKVSLSKIDKDLALSVRDYGAGMKIDPERAFEKGFSTAEQTTLSSGRGIGMSAIIEAVDSLNGKVHFDSQPEGMQLQVVFPGWQEADKPVAKSA